jgi:predicted nucleotidyltransferase
MPAFFANGLQVVDKALLDEIVRRIVSQCRPNRIVLFGSQARGDAGPDSDVDLFVEMESNQRPLDRMISVAEVLSPRTFALDVFVYTPQEVAERRGDPGDLLAYVDAEGVVLYDRAAA